MKRHSFLLLVGTVFILSFSYVFNEYALEKEELSKWNVWKTFTPQSNLFTVSLPSSPQYAKDLIPIPGTDLKSRYDMYASQKLDGTLFLISVITYPNERPAALAGKEILRKNVEELMQGKPDYELKKKIENRFKGQDAIDFSFENKEFHIEGKAILHNNILYLLTNTSHKGHFDDEEYKHFIESFHLLNLP